MERLGISISEEELKKGIEEDGADGYEDEVQDEDLADYYKWLWLFVCFIFFIFYADSCNYMLWQHACKEKVKVKKSIAVGKQPHRYGNSRAI